MSASIMFFAQAIGAPWMGVVIPAVIFIVSFLVAFFLYRHFAKKIKPPASDEKAS